MHGTHVHNAYLPAAGKDFLLPLYDPLVKLLGADRARAKLLDSAALQPGLRILDIGCGTGTLAVLIKRRFPGIEVVGLDPDPKALARSRRKAARAAVRIQFDQGFADALPYPDASFDRVLSSLMLHHLPKEAKRKALGEIRRVLKPGGSLHLLDFAGAAPDERNRLARWLHASPRLQDNSADLILGWMREAGFPEPQRYATASFLAGNVDYYRAEAPPPVDRIT